MEYILVDKYISNIIYSTLYNTGLFSHYRMIDAIYGCITGICSIDNRMFSTDKIKVERDI